MTTFIVISAIMAMVIGFIFNFVLGCAGADFDSPPAWAVAILVLVTVLMYIVVFFAGYQFAKVG